MQLLEFNNSTKVLDINLRPPHYEKESIEKLLYKADVLKLNDHELKLIAGWYKGYTDVASQLAFLQQKFEVPTLLVTLGDKGAMLKKGDNIFHHKGYRVNVCDTIGSGDAFLAGYLYKSAQNKSPEEALSFGNALGAFIASKQGACPAYTLDEVTALFSS